jgi:hypothetical protein
MPVRGFFAHLTVGAPPRPFEDPPIPQLARVPFALAPTRASTKRQTLRENGAQSHGTHPS